MNLLILLEDEQYAPIVEQIKKNSVAHVEISNIDFNIKKSLMSAQTVILLGGEEPYRYLKSEYGDIVKEKLLFTTYESEQNLDLEIAIHIASGVTICKLPDMNASLEQVVGEVTHQIFDGTLKVILTSGQGYNQVQKAIKQVESSLQNIVESNSDKLPVDIIEQIFKFFVKKPM